jgi:penicillin-insensitive murein DD-endopeptidase
MRILNFCFNAVFAAGLLLALFAVTGLLNAFRPQTLAAVHHPKRGAKAHPARRIAQTPPKPAVQAAATPVSPSSAATAPAAGVSANEADAAPSAALPGSAPAAGSAPFRTAAVPSGAPVPPASPGITKKSMARDLFGAAKEPANLAAKSIGFYAKGCLAGGRPLPVNGSAWQVMRVSRNRNWGHPSLIKYIEHFAKDAKEKDSWPGLLVGDLSMPRGGPMPFGHASHQVGLDVDIWYRPEPDHELSAQERESIPMESFLVDPGHVNPQVWKPEYEQLLRRAVSYPEVSRIFVNPAIKKWLCDNAKGDRKFLHKITPIMGHDDHFHVRLVCPAENPGCQNQAAVHTDEGCGKGLDKWVETLSKVAAKSPVPVPAAPPAAAPKPADPKSAAKGVVKRKPISLGELPVECETVLKAEPQAAPPVTAAR